MARWRTEICGSEVSGNCCKMQLLQTDEQDTNATMTLLKLAVWWRHNDVSWDDIMWLCRVESYAVSHARNDRRTHRLDPQLHAYEQTCTHTYKPTEVPNTMLQLSFFCLNGSNQFSGHKILMKWSCCKPRLQQAMTHSTWRSLWLFLAY